VAAHQSELTVDPAALQVLISQLTGVATEMGDVLRRSSFSPNIKERADCSAAVFTAAGDLLVQAEHIPVHLGSMPASVAAAIGAGIELRPGDQILLNDPFAGGTHLNDLTLVAPCHADGRLVGWVANRAHHADVGGMAPGSIPPAATEIYQEGLRIPPVLLTAQVAALLEANSRTPVERRGDLDAQVGANRVGAQRLAALAGRAGDFDQVLRYGERRMRAALDDLADGTWRAEDQMDSTGPGVDQQRPIAIRLALTIAGSAATFDFSGTEWQQPGNANAVAAVTASAVAWALRSVTDPTIPANGGTQRPVRLVIPDGSLVGARPPAAVGAGNVEVSQRVADVCLLALAAAAPDRVGAAGQGTMNNLILGGRSGWVYYETIGGGQGGRPGRAGMSGVHTGMTNTPPFEHLARPGMSGVHTAMTNTADTPTEALERAHPVRVLRYRLRDGSGGRGLAPGGDGIDRVIQVLEPTTLSLITERRVSRPWGLAGGEPGAAGENWLWSGGDESKRIPLGDKVTVEMRAGDAVQVLTPGGGGWGTPP
jgi:N-methylhydantoinase B/oxoprolinase/acetone carboxylase alpha subunit